MVIMRARKRIYDSVLEDHLAKNRQMAFVSGPRQVGKTTTCRAHADRSLNWDDLDDREVLLAGSSRIAESLGLSRLSAKAPVVLLDELHKFSRWKTLLKGFFDSYSERVKILVTGSSRMDTYRRVGDSLMGRYFCYRMHPFSVAETLTRDLPDFDVVVRPPKKPRSSEWKALWVHGGFPEPFIRREARFTRRWRGLRKQQLLREDIRDLTQLQHLNQIEMLVEMLELRSGQQIVLNHLAKSVRTGAESLRRWLEVLSGFYFGFLVRPWFRNVSRSLRKEPKWFLRDWSGVQDEGAKGETFVACHLLKAVEGWNDLGLGTFQLCYLRDKAKREVDFVVIRDGNPWFLVEVKTRESSLAPSLSYFQEQTRAPFAFQVVLQADYVDADCFARPGKPLVVPAKTFLSQLF